MQIFETHAHLLDQAFSEDRDEVINSMKRSGILYSVEACCKTADIPLILQLSSQFDFILPTAGIHPEELDENSTDDLKIVEKTAENNKLYAIGEIGLDYHYDDMYPAEAQRKIFDEQISIAEQYGLPVIIHDRDAHGDCMDILRSHRGKVKGIMHCYSGSWEMAKECLDIGLYLGFGGVITFKNAKKNKTVLINTPVSRIVFETDCPYMTPEPFRGKRNDPSLIPYIIRAAAEIRNEEPDYLADTIFKNSKRVFGLN